MLRRLSTEIVNDLNNRNATDLGALHHVRHLLGRTDSARNEDAMSSRETSSANEDLVSVFAQWVRAHHRRLYDLLDSDLIEDHYRFSDHLEKLRHISGHADFSGKKDGGRGGMYRDGQKRYPLVREFGYRKLFSLMVDSLSPRLAIVDALGGSGTLTRASRLMYSASEQPYMISADACLAQIEAAMKECLPCVPQAVQSTLFRDDVLDVALFGYGLHHVPREDRPGTVMEAYRYLKPGGRIVLMDFEEGSPTARWYSEALDTYTETGHKCDHFTRSEFQELLSDSGFLDVRIQNVYDPFIFDTGSAVEARELLLSHLVYMFGMVRLMQSPGESETDYVDRIDQTLTPFATSAPSDVAFEKEAVNRFCVRQVSSGLFRSEFPRVALVATAVKG